jgi:AraC-like DNA-binding protein
MDNYFSDMEAGRLRWVAFSFFAALAVGITALFSSLFMSTITALLFAVMFDIFYLYFAIRFINYAYQFQVIECAMDAVAPEDEDTAPESRETVLSSSAQNAIETGLKTWTDGKLFLQPGLTIDDVSRHIGTNSKYLSLYINQNRNQTFRGWINALRIEEAKHLLTANPDRTVSEIASHTGFTSQSHFSQQFRAITGASPLNWRKQSKN